MLQDIRDKAQGWIAYAIVILITIPFALWGIQSYLGGGSEPVAASVNGKEITDRQLDQQYQRYMQNLREQLGAAYRPELFDENRVRKEVLNQIVREDLILQTSQDMGLRTGDPLVQETILGIEAFQKDGKFDQAIYERAVRLQGLSTLGFEDRIRRMLLTEQLSSAIQVSAFITERELKENIRLQNQTRNVDYFVVKKSDFAVSKDFSEEEIQAYYDEHKDSYRSPEQVKLKYLLLDGASIGKTLEVAESDLEAYYQDHIDQYGEPEQRQASHILLTLPADADQAVVDATKAKIEVLRARIEKGEDFAELAKSESQDPGSSPDGGDLGYFGKGIMDPAFEEAAFSLREGELSDAVRSRFGFHLIKLTGIKGGTVKSFAEAREQVEQAYRTAEGNKRYYEAADKLANLSYENPDSLEPAAEGLHLEIKETDWVGRNDSIGDLRSPKLMAAAFNDDVLHEGHNSEVIELDQNRAVVLRVVDHKEAANLPLAEVRESVVGIMQRDRQITETEKKSEELLASLKAGEGMDKVGEGHEIVRKEALKRDEPGVYAMLLSAVFKSPRPEEGKPVYGTAALGNGDYVVYAINSVTYGSADTLDANAQKEQQDTLRQLKGQNQYKDFVADLLSRAKIEYLHKTAKE